MIDTKEINYIIYSDKYEKNIFYASCFKKKLNIINLLNKNVLLTKICFLYNKNHNTENNIFLKKHIFSQRWYWPIKNLNMKFFYQDSTNEEGIEIEGTPGQSVFSSAKGKVVYIGDIFKSYGKLIIIKHDNNYFSIYGFNKKIFIKLNDQVNENQKISTLEFSKNHLSKLYFEIRFKGNPINLLYLFPNIKLKKH